ncbi:hypothetical protein Tdes44962_MAKER00838 [Teratosphaeria destructans]|uniref:Uncharacterized protein n=1 Tax=Teratosphaeria destructans TaxID=418781 RepID=A0A9W7SKM3_9PEZI|nr:hypothetical protein Tdes44962_MAKER00838 [Teratosphaeria destructans]
MRPMGMRNRRKNTERKPKPLAARVYHYISMNMTSARCITDYDAVVPGEYGKFIQSSNEIPTGSNVASKEDAASEDGDWVHRVAQSCSTSLMLR